MLGGCAGSMPQSGEEFRSAAAGAALGKVQTVEANRPLADVTRTFQAKAAECLDVGVRATEQSRTVFQNVRSTYKGTVLASGGKTELDVQRHFESGALIPGGQPAGGLYMVVAVATPIDKSRTKVEISGAAVGGAQVLARAIAGWATGQDASCPDMTKV